MPAALQTGALSVMICTQESTPTCSMVLMNNSPIKFASLYFLRASTAFKNTGPFWEDTMKLISGWRAGSVYPSETILTLDEGLGRYHEIDEWMACRICISIENNTHSR